MIWTEKKYINLVSSSLDQFKWKSEKLANFRCPFCGDSKKNKYKARGYFFEKKDSFYYTCHNCQIGMGLPNFLKQISPALARQLAVEKFGKKPPEKTIEEEYLARPKKWSTIDLPRVSELSENHIASQYLTGRKIPRVFWNDLYYADDFRKFADVFIPGHGKEFHSDARLVIPIRDKNGMVDSVTGRSLDPDNSKRYIIVSTGNNGDNIFGIDKVDTKQQVYVTEGPFDAMTFSNMIAVGGSNLAGVRFFAPDAIYIFDNEPRNPDIMKIMNKVVISGCKVFIWPENVLEKDLNEMLCNGYTSSEIQHIIDVNSHSGLMAEHKFRAWKKT